MAQQLDLRRLHVSCVSCDDYVISSNAIARLSKSAETTREKFADEVKATTDPHYIYEISGANPDAPPHVDLEGRPTLRSDSLHRH